MAIQDDWTVDVVDKKITFTTAFVDDRPPSIYTANELYSFLQDLFDEPGFMQHEVPMSAQTPTQYTLVNEWFIDNESMKALYGGSIQTSSWTFATSPVRGITALRWASASSAPESGDIGKEVSNSGDVSTGVILAVDAARQIAWVRNTAGVQFSDADVVDDTGTGIDPAFTLETNRGVNNGENIWANLFSVGSLQTSTEVYVGQEDDEMGGPAYHQAASDDQLERRREKIVEWWDSDVDFATGSPNLLGGAGHFDILVLTQELGTAIDGQRLGVFARQHGKVYSHFELVGGVGNFVVPFSSTGADLNAADGPYNIGFDAGAGGKAQLDVGDIVENDAASPSGRLRAVVTAVVGTTSGDFDFYLLGEDEADGTLKMFIENEDVKVRGDAFQFLIDIAGTPVTRIGPATVQGITIVFANATADVDETGGTEQYACTINCNSVDLSDVYKRVQFLLSRGNQDGTAAGTPDELLQSGNAGSDENGEFYRAVGDIVFDYDGGTGTQPVEGDIVVGTISAATGVVTSIEGGTTGVCVLTQVKGTWVNNDIVRSHDAAGGNEVLVDTTTNPVTSIVANTAAPFGTFAGGRWFLETGVLLTNVPAGDANNWETKDLEGIRRAPPAQRVITFAGLIAKDRATLFEVDTANGVDITKDQNGIGGSGEAVGQTVLTLDANVANDVPTSGWMRVVDISSVVGQEYRFEYSSFSGADVTLRSTPTGTATSGGTSTVLNDTGIAASFGGDGDLKIGMIIRNTSTTEFAVVVRRIDDNSIETTVLSAGVWGNGDTWTSNNVPIALVDADTVYFGFIDDISLGSTITKTIKFVGTTECIARFRFSSPDLGGQRQNPFQQLGIQVTDADLTVTAIRTPDTIAA